MGTEPAGDGVKRGIRVDQKAKRVNNLAFLDPVCKTSTPGSNPGGASNQIKELPTSAGANVGDVDRTITVHRRVFVVRSENQSLAAAWDRAEAR